MGSCEFCQILQNPQSPIIHSDSLTFSFHDIDNKTAKTHILVCPKKCIPNSEYLTIKDIPLLRQMQKNAENILKNIHQNSEKPSDNKQQQNFQWRFGYHRTPYISVDHLHLHGFLLPIQSQMNDQILYSNNNLLRTTNRIIQQILHPRL